MIVALGLNLLGLSKIKVANLLPAMLFAPLMLALYNWPRRCSRPSLEQFQAPRSASRSRT